MKWGKTTLFANLIRELYNDMSKGLLISCFDEKGYKALEDLVVADCPTWPVLMDVVDELTSNKEDNDFRLIAFDTVDALVMMAQQQVINIDYRKTGQKHEFNACLGGFGAGRRKVEELISNVIARLEACGYGLVFIGHVKYKDIKEKNGDSYQMLTSNLNTDYDSIFSNRCDICMMGTIDKDISDGRVTGTTRHMWFRGDGFVDAGGRFGNIEQKVELSAENYIEVVTNAIKASLKNKKDDKYIEDKKRQEREERDAYYQAHKEELSSEEAFEAASEPVDLAEVAKTLQGQIKDVLSSLDAEEKKAKRAALKSAGLPDTYTKVVDVEVLKQILATVSE